VCHGFGQTKFAYGGLIIGSSQFTLLGLLPQLPLIMMLSLKVVKIDSKTSNLLCKSKSVTHSVVQKISRFFICCFLPHSLREMIDGKHFFFSFLIQVWENPLKVWDFLSDTNCRKCCCCYCCFEGSDKINYTKCLCLPHHTSARL